MTVAMTFLLLAVVAGVVLATRGTATPQSEVPESTAQNRPYVEVGAWSGRTYPADAVVVGYDAREHTRAAVAFAVEEASRRDRPLVVLHAVHYPGMIGEPGPGLMHRDPGALEAAEDVTARGVAEARALRPELEVVGATEITGPARALREALPHADLVVVGTRGRGALASKILGARRGHLWRPHLMNRKQGREPMNTESIATDPQDTLVELTGRASAQPGGTVMDVQRTAVLTPVLVEDEPTLDLPDVWGHGSFPASDPPANW